MTGGGARPRRRRRQEIRGDEELSIKGKLMTGEIAGGRGMGQVTGREVCARRWETLHLERGGGISNGSLGQENLMNRSDPH